MKSIAKVIRSVHLKIGSLESSFSHNHLDPESAYPTIDQVEELIQQKGRIAKLKARIDGGMYKPSLRENSEAIVRRAIAYRVL